MITFTKEQLIASAHARIEFAEMMLAGELEPLKERTWSIELELARIALASLEAEAVEWLLSGGGAKNNVSFDSGNAYADPLREVTPLYTAPPAPVSVPDAMEMDDDFDSAFEHGKAVGWNACRAAMLQGADRKTELTVWYGSMPESNGKANWTAILHRKGEGRCMDGFTIDRSEYPGRVLYAADRVRYLIGEKSERPSILDYDAYAHSGYVRPGNSPVIEDCWVACSEQMPEEGCKVIVFCPLADESNDPPVETATYKGGREYYHGFDCYCEPTHWMPFPAAPQQEVK